MSNYSVSIILPGYNEEGNIEETVKKCMMVMDSLGVRYELLIIDNASTDKTGEIADRLAQEHPQIRVIHNLINLELGLSLLLGYQEAKMDLALFECMDYHFDLNELRRILPLFHDCDIVNMVRQDRKSHSRFRRMVSRIHIRLIRFLFRVPFREFNFTQIYKREILNISAVRSKSPAFATAELLIRTIDEGHRFKEVVGTPLPRERGESHFGKPRDILWTFTDIICFWLERRNGKKQVNYNKT